MVCSVTDPVHQGEGQTAGERKLKALADQTFLSLWSYPGVFRDQGAVGGSRDGKEVCDLLIVFDPHVIIFSDKDCRFPDGNTDDLQKRWDRWFRRAVLASADQIWGAERWIRAFPDRLFLDRRCSKRFPYPLPPLERLRLHRVVVAHDGARACRDALGGSGSLVIAPEHRGPPFTIPDLDPAKGFVHVFDDTSLDIVMSNLDTIADFVAYLERKERLIRAGRLILATGEEELLAYYLWHVDRDGNHDFVLPVGADALALKEEGYWAAFSASEERQAELAANTVSYLWDRMIGMFNESILDGTIESVLSPTVAHHEARLRMLAREPRARRRGLATALGTFIESNRSSDMAIRVVAPTEAGVPYYVFVVLRYGASMPHAEYRQARQRLLEACCGCVKLRYPDAEDIVGVATETDASLGHSEDVMYLDARRWTAADGEWVRERQEELGIFRDMKVTEVTEPVLRRVRQRIEAPGGRNEPCPCGSGLKSKKCCGRVSRRP